MEFDNSCLRLLLATVIPGDTSVIVLSYNAAFLCFDGIALVSFTAYANAVTFLHHFIDFTFYVPFILITRLTV